jgi:hypothetical protein
MMNVVDLRNCLDGWWVHGEDTLLHFHHTRIRAATQTQPAAVFELTAEDCAEVFDEASALYHRLIVLFRLKDWTRVERDAAQVLCLLEFARRHARCAEDRVQLDPWRSHITRVHAVARAMILLEKGQSCGVLQTARETVGLLGAFDNGAPDHGKLVETLLESVRGSLTPHPVFHPHEEYSFLRQGDYWTIRYQWQATIFKTTRESPNN